MATTSCEAVILDAMARLDGEQPTLSAAEIEAHISTCGRCASELEQLRSTAVALARVHRAPVMADMWPMVSSRLNGVSASRWGVAIAVFISLILWRVFEQAAVDPLALWSRLVAIALATVLFVFLRANPFRIEPRLT
jgi:anti-sigma factor RsiW